MALLVDFSLVAISFFLCDTTRPWIASYDQVLRWCLAPLQVTAIYFATMGYQSPTTPQNARRWLRPIYAVAETLYGLVQVLGVGSFLWLFFFLPNHPFGHIWSLGIALFGGILAFGLASQMEAARPIQKVIPTWLFLFLSEAMLDVRWQHASASNAGRFVVLVILGLSYLPLRLMLSAEEEIDLWDLCSACLSLLLIAWNIGR